MKNTKLFMLFSTFEKSELLELEKWLASPFHNQREDVRRLFQYLKKASSKPSKRYRLEKEAMYDYIYPKDGFDLKKLNYLFSFLFQYLENYLIQKEIDADDFAKHQYLLGAYRKRNLNHLFQMEWKKTNKKLTQSPYRNPDYHYHQYQLQYEYSKVVTQNKRTTDFQFQECLQEFTVYFLANSLRHYCTLISHQNVTQDANLSQQIQTVLALVKDQDYLQKPAIALYYHGFQLFYQEDGTAHFQQLKQLLVQHQSAFSKAELRDLYLLTINYCIRELNNGKLAFLQEVFQHYKAGLEQEIFMENGILSNYTYNNIAVAGITLQEYNWVEQFLYQYKDYLKAEARDNTFNYNLANLYYNRKDYDKAMDLLRQLEFSDVLHKFTSKAMLAKIYYELDEIHALDSFLDSFQIFVYRQKTGGYHQQGYLNFIRFLKKLNNITAKEDVEKVRQQVLVSKTLSERRWLLAQLKKE